MIDSPVQQPKVYIIISNWNGWKDTIECLESVFRLSYGNYQVIVRDNLSDDGSLEHIKAWADGRIPADGTASAEIRAFTHPPIAKPVRYHELSRSEAESGGRPADREAPLILIQNGSNLGFAGGNNVALRYAIARGDFAYVWLLNNDTVVRPDALDALAARMAEAENAGICGSTLIYYHSPDKVQAYGGASYNAWIARSRHIGMFRSPSAPIDRTAVELATDYIVGASMLVSRIFLREIGLMSEEYFLYCEEIDWAMRGKGRYTLAYAPESIVYHKEGAVIGGSYLRPREKSILSEYYAVRSKVLFTRKYYRSRLPIVYATALARLLLHAVHGKWDRVRVVWNAMLLQGKI